MAKWIIKLSCALFFLTSPLLLYGYNDDEKITYSITIDASNPKLALVSASFIPKDSLLYMSAGAQQFQKRWAKFVHNIQAKNRLGKALILDELPDASWKIHAPLNQEVVLTYTIKLDHENHKWSGGIDGAAYANDWGVFYTGRSLFILNGDERENIEIKFDIPNDWKVTTPWNTIDNDEHSYVTSSQSALSQAMFFAGTHQEFTVNRDEFELVFALGGDDIIAQQEDFKKLAEGVFDYYIDLMGGIPKPPEANKFSKVAVIVNPASSTDGEVIGNSISILIEQNGDQMSKVISRFIFAHEFFHLWNGKSFFPEHNDVEWFKEGFTNYYTLKALYVIGFLNNQSYLNMLSNFFYQRYINDSGVGNLSMTKGEEKHDHWGLIYGGGLFVGIAQDIVIRSATDNEKNIDDLLRKLYQKYGGTDKGYTLKELEEIMTELSGKDQSKFMNTYVIGTKGIPIHEYLNSIGFEAKVENKQLRISKKANLTPIQQKIIKGFYGQKE